MMTGFLEEVPSEEHFIKEYNIKPGPQYSKNIKSYHMLDQYYDQVRLLNADEFISMWRDGNYEHTRVDRDFIALRRK